MFNMQKTDIFRQGLSEGSRLDATNRELPGFWDKSPASRAQIRCDSISFLAASTQFPIKCMSRVNFSTAEAMEEQQVKKEIVVKRLSAFKFAVEVNTKEQNVRASVIQKAPPASPSTTTPVTPPASDTILIRQVIMQRIMEILLWKLLGEERLKCCGYPDAPACALLRRVVQLSNIDHKPIVEAAAPCDGSLACFTEQVKKFLNICAPTEEQWSRFGWKALSEEAILRKIYEEQLSPNLCSQEIDQDKNILTMLEDLKLLCHWESQGFTTITKRRADAHPPMLVSTPTIHANQTKVQSYSAHTSVLKNNQLQNYPRFRIIEERRFFDTRVRMSHSSIHCPRPHSWIRQPRPHRIIPIPYDKILREGAETSYYINHRRHPISRRLR